MDIRVYVRTTQSKKPNLKTFEKTSYLWIWSADHTHILVDESLKPFAPKYMYIQLYTYTELVNNTQAQCERASQYAIYSIKLRGIYSQYLYLHRCAHAWEGLYCCARIHQILVSTNKIAVALQGFFRQILAGRELTQFSHSQSSIFWFSYASF